MPLYLQQLERLKRALQVESDTAFSQILEVSQGAISGAKKREQLPHAWFFHVHEKTGVSIDWLYCGHGAMFPDATPAQAPSPAADALPETSAPCPRCAKLETELDVEKSERRELSLENRQWAAKAEQLLRDNCELRVRCATLEEQQKKFATGDIFHKQSIISSSKTQIDR